jgi:hypothetical protein
LEAILGSLASKQGRERDRPHQDGNFTEIVTIPRGKNSRQERNPKEKNMREHTMFSGNRTLHSFPLHPAIIKSLPLNLSRHAQLFQQEHPMTAAVSNTLVSKEGKERG